MKLIPKRAIEPPAKPQFTRAEMIEHGVIEPPAGPASEPETDRNHRRELPRDRYLPEIARKLPQSEDAEKGILGSILLSPKKAMYALERTVTPEYFYTPAHSQIFRTLKEMHDADLPIDLITVTERLEASGALEAVGGAAYVTDLFMFVPTAANLDYYIKIAREKFVLRQLFAAATRSAEEALAPDANPKEALTRYADEGERIQVVIDYGREDSEEHTFSQLEAFDTKNDPNAVLGRRWLCRGGSCLWVGQAGLGKSSLAMQAGIMWAQGLSLWGVAPTQRKPLKSLYIQAENDEGDMAEMLQGVMRTLPLPEGINRADFIAELQKNMIFHRDVLNTGKEFAKSTFRLIAKHQPDLVWVDPLLSYVGGDLSKQEVASHFLRNLMNPIALDTGVVWMMLHHTGKPSTDPKAKANWTDHDFSYAAFGSSELVNWARAVNVLRSVGNGVFELRFAKRGRRAGLHEFCLPNEFEEEAETPKFTDIAYLQHAQQGIFWEHIPKPAEAEQGKTQKGGQFAKTSSEGDLLALLVRQGGSRTAAELQRLAAGEEGISKATFYRLWKTLRDRASVIEHKGRWLPTETKEKE